MADLRPQIIGSVVVAYVKEVERRQLLELVRSRAGPELEKVLAKRPLPIQWIDAAAMAVGPSANARYRLEWSAQ